MKKKDVNQEYAVAVEGKDIKEGTRGSRVAAAAVNTFFGLSIVFSVSLVVFSIIFFISIVTGPSMMNTINVNAHTDDSIKDSVLVNRYAAPQKGDIIITKYYWNQNASNESYRWSIATEEDEGGRFDYFVKRLIAVGGDTIKFQRGERTGYDDKEGKYVPLYDVYINGELLDESEYLHSHWGELAHWPPHGPWHEFIIASDAKGYVSLELTIPEGKVFFMGDNRGSASGNDYVHHSYDCREFGPQPRENIIGTVKDIINGKESMPEYVFRKIGELFSFGRQPA